MVIWSRHTVSKADAAAHEATMRTRGFQLVKRDEVDAKSWRYDWAPRGTDEKELERARDGQLGAREVLLREPAAPESTPQPEPVAVAQPTTRTKPVKPPKMKAGEAAVRSVTSDLIEGYRAALREATTLNDEAKALVTHVVAVSCERAARQARAKLSDADAEALEQYRKSFANPVGAVTNTVRDEARDWAFEQVATSGPGVLSVLWGKLVAAFGVMVAAGAGVMAFGREAIGHGSGIRLLMLGAGAIWVWGANWARETWSDIQEAMSVSQPVTPLLARTLDDRERRFFFQVGSQPPQRVSLAVAGPTYAAVILVCAGLFVLSIVLIYAGAADAFKDMFDQAGGGGIDTTPGGFDTTPDGLETTP